MTLASMLVPRLTPSGVVKVATPQTAQALIDGASPGAEVVLEEGRYRDQLHVWHARPLILRLRPGCQIEGNAALRGYYGIHSQNANLDIRGELGSLVRVPNGHGIGGSGGRVIVSGTTVTACGGSGFQFNSGGGQVVQIDRNDVSDCGRELNLTTEPGYWRYGTHCCYVGGGSDGTPTRAVVVGNYFHDQHSGYHLELGGQARGGIVAWNRMFRHDGAADPGNPVGDRLGNAVQVYSSYLGSRDNLIVNNLWRNIIGYGASGASDTTQGVVRNNVGWAIGKGILRTVYGGNPTLTDGGGNVTRDLATLADCLAAGLFDPAYVPPWASSSPPPPPPDRWAKVRAEMQFFKTSSPHVYGALDEMLKVLGP